METVENLEALYLDYLNNFLTVSAFADHYGMSDYQAEIILDAGRQIFNYNIIGHG
jgi:hypothetical protein